MIKIAHHCPSNECSLRLPQDLHVLASAYLSYLFSLLHTFLLGFFLLHHFLPRGLFKCSPLFLKISPPSPFTLSLFQYQFRFYFPWKTFPNRLSRFGDPMLCYHSNPYYSIIALTSHQKALFNVLSLLFYICSSQLYL